MAIRRRSLAAGASAATGLAVIVDTLRSFSSEPLLMCLGAARLLLESGVERCFALRAERRDDTIKTVPVRAGKAG